MILHPANGTAQSSPAPWLAVDLDGTLTPCDTLWECVAEVVQKKPLQLLGIILSLSGGKAKFKRVLTQASIATLDISVLPWSNAVLEEISLARQQRRRIILITGADQAMADKVAAHLGCFDLALGSDSEVNLVGAEKAAALKRICGESGFDYIGNESADLEVWHSAETSLVTHGPHAARLVEKMRHRGSELKILDRVEEKPSPSSVSPRPGHWLKNLLVLAPMLAAHDYMDGYKWIAAMAALFCFSLCSYGAYFFNDILDRNADRSHPKKRSRPIASGAVPIPVALAAALFLPAAGLVGAWGLGVLPGLTLYCAATLWYSLYLKRLPVIDMVTLACLYCLRIFVGGEATGDPVSAWMATFAGFLFLSLAASKRYSEIYNLKENDHPPASRPKLGPRENTGRGYTMGDEALIMSIGVGAACITPLILVLYLLDERSTMLYANPPLLMSASVVIFMWLGTLWRDATLGLLQSEDPLRYSITIPRSLFLLALFGILVMLSTYPSQ